LRSIALLRSLVKLSRSCGSAFARSCVENPLAEPERFWCRFDVLIAVDVLDLALAFVASDLANCVFVFDVLR
jgi:hypothetical protein